MAKGIRSTYPHCGERVLFEGDADDLIGSTIICNRCGKESKFGVDPQGDYALIAAIPVSKGTGSKK